MKQLILLALDIALGAGLNPGVALAHPKTPELIVPDIAVAAPHKHHRAKQVACAPDRCWNETSYHWHIIRMEAARSRAWHGEK